MITTLKRVRSSQSGRKRLRRAQPEIALILSTYEKPWHLRRVLTSIAMQQGVAGKLELIVTDDGSNDRTLDIVEEFSRRAPFRVAWTTHAHAGFQLARCRNEGAAQSEAPYLLFLDGDCVLPPDHVQQHLAHRRKGEVMGGYCVRLDERTSRRVDEEAIRSQAFLRWAPRRELRSLARRHCKARFYRLLRHPRKPKLAGGNIGIWRSDLERVNGYDEKFVGWGGEDDDLRNRLGRTGLRIGSILRWTHTYHLWHPPAPSHPGKISQGGNFDYLRRPGKLTCCRHGMRKRQLAEMDIRLVGSPTEAARLWPLLPEGISQEHLTERKAGRPEVEVLLLPGSGIFSGRADCNLVIDLAGERLPRSIRRQVHLLVSDHRLEGESAARQFPLCDLPLAWEAIC